MAHREHMVNMEHMANMEHIALILSRRTLFSNSTSARDTLDTDILYYEMSWCDILQANQFLISGGGLQGPAALQSRSEGHH